MTSLRTRRSGSPAGGRRVPGRPLVRAASRPLPTLDRLRTASRPAQRRPGRNFGYDMGSAMGGDGYYIPPDFRGNPPYDGLLVSKAIVEGHLDPALAADVVEDAARHRHAELFFEQQPLSADLDRVVVPVRR